MSDLNREQRRASIPRDGVTLVIAGAGTGKTRIIVERIKNIIDSGRAEPENILILTFNRKAAEEIKHRLRTSLGVGVIDITSGTFHSFCLAFLKDNNDIFLKSYGFSQFPSILDQEGVESLKFDLLQDSIDQFLGLPIKVVSGLLETIDKLDQKTLIRLNHLGIISRIRDVNNRINDYKRSRDIIDFRDMMGYTIDILSNNEGIRNNTIDKYKYILIDEFQDTSEDNFRLIKLLMHNERSNLFLVGDDWQSIYGFRGSKVDYIIKMKRYFSYSEIHKLSINYRSRREIVDLSNRFIKNNRHRTNKRLRSFKGRGGVVKDYYVEDLRGELEIIQSILVPTEIVSSKIAILYRNNWQGGYIRDNIQENELLKSDRVELLTMHSSKGLEFDTVIIAGISDDIIPDASSDLEEERRLLYVALTRAKERLHIIHYKSASGDLSMFAKELGFSI
ncbi:MAG: ATP-dependent helicase [Spirochaetota bacterium]|nr:ATP-dependent helicase [Spirochaetota bacterium]